MWNFIAQAGLATTPLEFTHDLSLLLVGLLGLVCVSGAMIAFDAVRHYRSETVRPTATTAPTAPGYREAA
jgi:hypothetical protein